MKKFDKIEEVDPKTALLGVTIKNAQNLDIDNGLRETETRDTE